MASDQQSSGWRAPNNNWRSARDNSSPQPSGTPRAGGWRSREAERSGRSQPNSPSVASPISPGASSGHRFYLGNLAYATTPAEVESMLQSHGFGDFTKIDISVDPFTARNPGYCFVEMPSAEALARVLAELPAREAAIGGRVVKVGASKARGEQYEPAFQRWGEWKGEGAGRERGGERRGGREGGPYEAERRVQNFRTGSGEAPDGLRLWIGGLGRMENQAQNDAGMRELFGAWNVTAVSKRYESQRPTENGEPRHYCYVDLGSAEEAADAAGKLDGMEWENKMIKVKVARSDGEKRNPRSQAIRTGGSWR